MLLWLLVEAPWKCNVHNSNMTPTLTTAAAAQRPELLVTIMMGSDQQFLRSRRRRKCCSRRWWRQRRLWMSTKMIILMSCESQTQHCHEKLDLRLSFVPTIIIWWLSYLCYCSLDSREGDCWLWYCDETGNWNWMDFSINLAKVRKW